MSSLIRSSIPSPISDSHFYISGAVTIHPSAAIAPGVMLQADPNSELIVAAGVCIGTGCVLHAHQGVLELESGATLGSNVLIIGQGKIGINACIGAMTTIINNSVLPHQMIPPGSLLGDGSRQVIVVEPSKSSQPAAPKPAPPSAAVSGTPQSESASSHDASGATASTPTPSSSSEPGEVRVIYGRAYLERMMLTMFPHRPANSGE